MTEYITNPDEVSYPSYDVAIRNNLTGKVRNCHMDLTWEAGTEFWWTEGNFGCDCNQSLVFAQAGGENTDHNSPCGDSAYTAIEAIFPDGKRFKIDGYERP